MSQSDITWNIDDDETILLESPLEEEEKKEGNWLIVHRSIKQELTMISFHPETGAHDVLFAETAFVFEDLLKQKGKTVWITCPRMIHKMAVFTAKNVKED